MLRFRLYIVKIVLMKFAKTLSLLLICCSCSTQSEVRPTWQQIQGRDRTIPVGIYQARVPTYWQRHDPDPMENLADTTKPLCNFIIEERDERITITIHNFPSESLEMRIPAAAQVSRWQQQTKALPGQEWIFPYAHGGFAGLGYFGPGIIAFSLQLAEEHYRSLSKPPASRLHDQMRADYTIKAIGPRDLLTKHATAISDFARSFELIEEL